MSINVHKTIKAEQFNGSNGAEIAQQVNKPFEINGEGHLVIEGLVAKPGDWFVWSYNVAFDPAQGLVVVFEESPVPNRHFNIKYGRAVQV